MIFGLKLDHGELYRVSPFQVSRSAAYCLSGLNNFFSICYYKKIISFILEGQSIFNRLSKQLKSITKKIQKTIDQYNKVGYPYKELPEILTFENVKDIDNVIYKGLTSHQVTNEVPSTMKQELIQLKCLLDRCAEEKVLLKNEMKSVISWNKNQYRKVKAKLGSATTAGETAFLLREGMYFEFVICKLNYLFKEFIGEGESFDILLTENILNDDFEKMQNMLQYISSLEELGVEDPESDFENDEGDEEEDFSDFTSSL